jgi:hypothetical protein
MASSAVESRVPQAAAASVNDSTLSVDLSDGRTIAVPLAWYPRLLHASPKEQGNWRLIAGGDGIHWPDLDEDISVEDLLAGRASREAPASLKNWLAARARRSQPGARSANMPGMNPVQADCRLSVAARLY